MTDPSISHPGEIISRKEALALGLKRYRTGVPCIRGHVTDRFVSGSRCVTCSLEDDRKHYAESPKKKLEIGRKWRSKNREKVRKSGRARYAANPEAGRAYSQKWRSNNLGKIREYDRKRRSENGDIIKERSRELYAENRDAIRERRNEWNSQNREKIHEYQRKYRSEHPEHNREKAHKRRAIKNNATIGERALIQAQIAKWQKTKRLRCYLCGNVIAVGDMHIDHIIPLSKGGKHAVENIAPACSRCNLSKGARDVNEILKQGILL